MAKYDILKEGDVIKDEVAVFRVKKVQIQYELEIVACTVKDPKQDKWTKGQIIEATHEELEQVELEINTDKLRILYGNSDVRPCTPPLVVQKLKIFFAYKKVK